MITWLETHGKTHLFYIILIVAGVAGFRTWLSEHDARVDAERQVKQSQQLVKSLQDGIASRDADLSKRQQVVVRVVHDVASPAQAVAAVPLLVTPQQDQDLQTKVAVDDPKAVEVQAVPFAQLLGDYKLETQENQTCQADLVDEKKIVTEDEAVIKALKKRPRFWRRVGGVVKEVGLGVLAGFVLAEVRR
jgi:hypothetical protein